MNRLYVNHIRHLSRHACCARGGFTIVEVTVALTLLSAVVGFSLATSFDSLRRSNFRDERDTVVALLGRARSLSMSNICHGKCTDGARHGVALHPYGDLSYVLFEGDSYDSRDVLADVKVEGSDDVFVTGDMEIVFEQLSGNATSAKVVLSGSNGQNSAIEVSELGRISWTN